MSEHLQLSDIPKFCAAVKTWLQGRYASTEVEMIWQATSRQYEQYLTEKRIPTQKAFMEAS